MRGDFVRLLKMCVYSAWILNDRPYTYGLNARIDSTTAKASRSVVEYLDSAPFSLREK